MKRALNRTEYKTKYIILILVEDFIFILFVFRHHARLVVPYPNHYISLHNDTQSHISSNPAAISYFIEVPILLLLDILFPDGDDVLLSDGILNISSHSAETGAFPSLKSLRLIHSGSSIQSAGAAL